MTYRYRTILVYLNDRRRAEAVLEPAVELANRYQAHLIGIHVYASVPAPPIAVPYGSQVLGSIALGERTESDDIAATFARMTANQPTACSRWQANQFLLLLHMGAYWLLHSVRLAAPKRSRWRGATFATIRSTFVKLGCRIEELKSRIRLSFSAHLPHADAIAVVTARLCAQAPQGP